MLAVKIVATFIKTSTACSPFVLTLIIIREAQIHLAKSIFFLNVDWRLILNGGGGGYHRIRYTFPRRFTFWLSILLYVQIYSLLSKFLAWRHFSTFNKHTKSYNFWLLLCWCAEIENLLQNARIFRRDERQKYSCFQGTRGALDRQRLKFC